MTHTPAPWQHLDGAILSDKLNDYGNFYVASMPEHNNDQTKANAQLIAAAPELLDSLKIAVGWIQQYAPQNRRKIVLDKILGVIAKAEGKK